MIASASSVTPIDLWMPHSIRRSAVPSGRLATTQPMGMIANINTTDSQCSAWTEVAYEAVGVFDISYQVLLNETHAGDSQTGWNVIHQSDHSDEVRNGSTGPAPHGF